MHRAEQVTTELCGHCANAFLYNDEALLSLMANICGTSVPFFQVSNSCRRCIGIFHQGNSILYALAPSLTYDMATRGQYDNATFCTQLYHGHFGRQCHFNGTPCTEIPFLAGVYSTNRTAKIFCTWFLDGLKWNSRFAWINVSVSIVSLLSSLVTLAILRNKDTVRIDALRTMLTALNIADVLMVVLNVVVNVLPELRVGRLQAVALSAHAVAQKYVEPVRAMALTFSTYLLVLITVERWLAVCRTFYYQRVVHSPRRLLASIACIAVLSVALNAPMFWHYHISQAPGARLPYAERAALLDSAAYVWGYVVAMYGVAQIALPLAAMTALNGHIAAVALAARRYKRVHGGGNDGEQNADVRLAAMCAGIGVSFFALNSCGLSLRVLLNVDGLLRAVGGGEVHGKNAAWQAAPSLHMCGAFANDLLCFAFVRKYRLAVAGWLRRCGERAELSTEAGGTAATADTAL